MKLIELLNAGLQTVATGLVVYGALAVYEAHDYVGGAILIVAGLVAYVLYERFPSSTPPAA